MSSNLPPGVSEGMIPGNRPQDIAAQHFAENIGDEELLDWIADGRDDREGCVLYHDEDNDRWLLESDEQPMLPEWPNEARGTRSGVRYCVLIFESRDDALAYAITFHDDELIEAMTEEHLEELADSQYDY